MPRFQLLVREPGKDPRTVSLDDPIVVGRSRSVDLTIDDEEVGRKQFRIGVTSGFVVLEGLGATNPTRVDDSIVKVGEKTTVPVGGRIRVGKSEFEIASSDAAEKSEPAAPPTNTMVAPGPGPGAGPGAPPPPADAGDLGQVTMPPRAGLPGAPPPPPPEGNDPPMNTMEFQRPGLPGPGNPGAGSGSPPAQAPPADGPEFGQTMAKGFRPGGLSPSAAQPPKPQPPKPQPPKPQPPKPQPPKTQPPKAQPPKPQPPKAQPPKAQPPRPQPPQPQPPKPQPAAPASPAAAPSRKPTTVAVRPEEMAAVPPPGGGDDIESRLHQSSPRLFVKGEGLKRPMRLLKTVSKVGRAETADVLLPHESVSEKHAEIRFDGEQWTLLDLGSTNGTMVDGKHLRGGTATIRRNALIGIGALQLVFLYVDRETATQDRRNEDRALTQLTRQGRIDRTTANDIRQMVRSESSQSIAEIVLRDTPIAAGDWAAAFAAARQKVSLLDRILRILSFGKR